jgi:hypothetical protein
MTTLAELATHFELFAVCGPCRRMARFDVRRLIDTLGGDCTTDAVRARVRCRTCGRRTNDIRIVYAGRCGGARGFHYRSDATDRSATPGSGAAPTCADVGGVPEPSGAVGGWANRDLEVAPTQDQSSSVPSSVNPNPVTPT